MKNLQKLNKLLEKIDKNAKDQFIKIYRTTDKRSELEWNTARPLNMMFLVPEKNRVAQNRISWGLYLCTKGFFFSKNRVTSRLLFKVHVSQVFFRTMSQN